MPAAALLFEDTLGGLRERGNARRAALLQEGIAARPRQHAVGEGQFAGLGERDERGGAEPEFAALAVDDEPLDPDCGSGRLNEQMQAVDIGENARRVRGGRARALTPRRAAARSPLAVAPRRRWLPLALCRHADSDVGRFPRGCQYRMSSSRRRGRSPHTAPVVR